MEFRHLKMFCAVAETGSFTAAAVRVHSVQSNITMRIKDLEAELQQQLFVRQKNGVVLTPAGRLFHEYAQRILQLADESRSVLQDSTVPRGELRLGSMETTAAIRLPMLLASYHERYPEVQLSLETGTTAELIKAVETHRLDAAFIGGQHRLSDLHQQCLFEEELVLVSHHRFETLSAITCSLSKQTILVFRTGCFYRSTLENWLYRTGLMVNQVMEMGTLDGIISCVAAGMGLTLLPRSVLASHNARHLIRCHEIPAEFSRIATVFIWSADVPMAPALSALIALAEEHFQPVVSRDSSNSADWLASQERAVLFQ